MIHWCRHSNTLSSEMTFWVWFLWMFWLRWSHKRLQSRESYIRIQICLQSWEWRHWAPGRADRERRRARPCIGRVDTELHFQRDHSFLRATAKVPTVWNHPWPWSSVRQWSPGGQLWGRPEPEPGTLSPGSEALRGPLWDLGITFHV